jgi:hypothetical protein
MIETIQEEHHFVTLSHILIEFDPLLPLEF